MRIFISLFALVLATNVAYSSPPTAESVDALLAASNAESRLESKLLLIEETTRKSMSDRAREQNLSPSEKQVSDAVTEEMVTVLRQELGWAALREVYIKVYTEMFTQAEIESLTAFYLSPGGAALIEKAPAVDRKILEIMQSRLAGIQERTKKAVIDAADGANADK